MKTMNRTAEETSMLPRARWLVGPLWLACATAFCVLRGLAASLFGDPPLAGESAARVVGALAPLVFLALGVLGTRRLWTGRGAGWPLLAVAAAPATVGIIAGMVALVSRARTAVDAAPDAVSWELVVEAACVPAMRGLAASACGLLVVQVESVCAFWAMLVRRGLGPRAADAGVGRGVATACAHVLLLVPLLPELASTVTHSIWDRLGMARAQEVERGWTWVTAGAIAVAAVSSTLLAASSPMLRRVGRDDERDALWRRAMMGPTSGSLAVLFFWMAADVSDLRPFGEPWGGSVGSESLSGLVLQCLLATGVFLAGAWSFWRQRPSGLRRRAMAWVSVLALGCLAAAPVALAHRLARGGGALDPAFAPSFPCVVVVRDTEIVDARRRHPKVVVTLEISNEMADDLLVESADFPDWQISGSRLVPAHGSSTLRTSREMRYADVESPIQVAIHVRSGERSGVLWMPQLVLPADPELRNWLASGEFQLDSLYNP
jgi:hypothetical protein